VNVIQNPKDQDQPRRFSFYYLFTKIIYKFEYRSSSNYCPNCLTSGETYLPVYLYKQSRKQTKEKFTSLFKLVLNKSYINLLSTNLIEKNRTSPLIKIQRLIQPYKLKNTWALTLGPTTLTILTKMLSVHQRASDTVKFRIELCVVIFIQEDIIYWTETETMSNICSLIKLALKITTKSDLNTISDPHMHYRWQQFNSQY